MRRRLPAGLRWRLLLALVATSAVTLGATALVVLPPLQDRLRSQSADSLETQVVAARPKFQDGVRAARREARADQRLPDRAGRRSRPSSAARRTRASWSLNDDLMPGDRAESPPGFLYDNEFSDEPRARDAASRCASARLGTTEIQREGDERDRRACRCSATATARPRCSSPTAS